MVKLDERMQMIGSAILKQAKLEAEDLIKKANGIREKEIAACEDEITTTMFGKVQQQTADLRQNTISEVARAQIKAQREIHLHREKLADQVFTVVQKRLADYAAGPEYTQNLLEDLRALKDSYDHSASTLYLREADLALSGEIKAIIDCKIEADTTILLGGFKLRNDIARVLVDETLDARLAAQKPWFRSHCGLKVM